MSGEQLLCVRNLRTDVRTRNGALTIVNDVSFDLAPGKVLGIVGESGSGKTMLSLSLMGLLPEGVHATAEEITLAGESISGLRGRDWQTVRGRKIGMVFQEPLTSFDPLYTMGDQISESLKRHLGLGRKAARQRTIELLDSVGIPRPGQIFESYPFQLSGGMRQRAMIAMALAPEPQLLIADEPTTALDVTIQAQILALLKSLQRDRGIGVLFVTHNLGVVAEIADEVMVMYGGQLMERSPVVDLFDAPQHPYTQALLEARPRLVASDQRLRSIPGQVPTLETRPSGCPFHPRCTRADASCSADRAPLATKEARTVACFHPLGGLA